jgi:SAM-dependent methyltransferase
MRQKIRIARGVVWHPVGHTHWVAALPGRDKREKCLLLDQPQMDFLERISASQELPFDTLKDPEKDIASKWLTPEFRLLEEVNEGPPPKFHERLAFAILDEYESARRFENGHNLAPYHQYEISDPFRQFEQVETTVSHLYRDPHPALDGKNYGAAFADILLEAGAVRAGHKILEVGCGTGIFGREFLREVKNRMPSIYNSLSYTFFDASPVLSRSQKKLNEEHGKIVTFVTGDVQTHAFPEDAFDLVIANEMIADLPVEKFMKTDTNGNAQAVEALEPASRFGLDLSDAPPWFVLNTGALKFLENVRHTLKPEGRAYITEYGSPYSYAKARTITDHTEFTIHFGHLLTASHSLGFKASIQSLNEFLHFAGDLKVLDDQTHHALFGHLMPFLGMEGDAVRIYTQDMFSDTYPELAEKTRNLVFVRLDSLGGIIYPSDFYALRLIKN